MDEDVGDVAGKLPLRDAINSLVGVRLRRDGRRRRLGASRDHPHVEGLEPSLAGDRRVLDPFADLELSGAFTWTNTSSPPSSAAMNPYPLSGLNLMTRPVLKPTTAIIASHPK
jgi:hypothetical protein